MYCIETIQKLNEKAIGKEHEETSDDRANKGSRALKCPDANSEEYVKKEAGEPLSQHLEDSRGGSQ